MKVLVFTIGPDRYGLPLVSITRVLPAAALKQVPLAPDFVAGLLDLHGEPVPVIDLSRLAGLARAEVWYDTRIILADYPLPGGSAPIALLAEHVTGVETLDPHTLREPGVASAPFLGQVTGGGTGGGGNAGRGQTGTGKAGTGKAGTTMLQLVELDQLLPPEVRALLFQPKAAP